MLLMLLTYTSASINTQSFNEENIVEKLFPLFLISFTIFYNLILTNDIVV